MEGINKAGVSNCVSAYIGNWYVLF